MPDITMCKGLGCPRKKWCWRYTAIPTPYRQSYFTTPPNKGSKCEYFWRDTMVKVPEKLISVSIIHVYHIVAESVDEVDDMDTTQIEEQGQLKDVAVDYIEVVEDLSDGDEEDEA